MKIAVCDDQNIQIDLMNQHINEWSKINNIDVYIDNYISGEAFLFEWSDYDKYDIVFLDIEMNKVSGIELSNIIREKNKIVDIVFVTGIFKYALHGYKVGALQYLLKPVKKTDLYECLDNALDRIKGKYVENRYITLETAKNNIKIDYDTIEYCIMFSPYIDIHTNTGTITLRKKIGDVERILPKESFIRCHRSYLVNIKYIKSITKDYVVLENGVNIPISRGKYKETNEAFINYFCQ